MLSVFDSRVHLNILERAHIDQPTLAGCMRRF